MEKSACHRQRRCETTLGGTTRTRLVAREAAWRDPRDWGRRAWLDVLKRRVANYPDALRRAVVQDYFWQAEFALAAFARKFAARADAYGTAACLTRVVNQLTLALFALNRKYLINDKTALTEIAEFECAPRDFALRVQKTLADLGGSPRELGSAVENITRLLRESVELADGLYRPRFNFPA